MPAKFKINKLDLNSSQYGFYGFEQKAGYIMIFTSPPNQRRKSYPHITIYYKKIKEKTVNTSWMQGMGGSSGGTYGGSQCGSQGHYFHITMDDYHYSRDSSGKYGRRFVDGVWKWHDMGSNVGMTEALAVCTQFEKLLERVISSKVATADAFWDDGPSASTTTNQKSDPAFETKTGMISDDIPDTWDSEES